MRRRNAILIPRNTALPATAKRVFRTQKANQKSILVQIVEGESANPEDCSQIGKCVVRDLPRDFLTGFRQHGAAILFVFQQPLGIKALDHVGHARL